MNGAIVTGANGFIGSHVVRQLLQKGIRVLALCHNGKCSNLPQSDLLTVYPYALEKACNFANICPPPEDTGYDVFYHFAWKGAAGAARADTALQLDNAQWTVDALHLAKALGCRRFVGAGSIMEHETVAAAFAKENQPGLGYIYGGGKLIAHVMAKSVAADIGIEFVWPMITNAYGVGEISPRLVNSTIRKILQGESPRFTAGTQNYDFVYIDDVARAFCLIGEKGKPFCEYLIGSSQARPLKEFLLEMKQSIAPDKEFIFGDVPFTGINLPLSCFDGRETEQDTGFRAEISFAEGTRKTRDWMAGLTS
ncbi:NAD-dependent epimerase/dehydratase family protein [Selenomonas ruminantium]|uniref:Nucleoside-diphosphate-sugar epimerase n=1 Tax=Selenomonas ruminantium TaxID=971 RepID=A0A1H0PNX6_SELRU|nr:NAD-dependent epimerase/dehydratase [Selenomonas ruminantium]SDP06288.1 Nucleoside-diphosphate-sugar epimerase [Selenomonas ruminantium]